MSAEQLIALQAAMADLSDLCMVAKGFTALQPQAELELLPQLSTMASELRRLLRSNQLEGAIQPVANQIIALANDWNCRIQAVRDTAAYHHARTAFVAQDQQQLAQALPKLFAGLQIAPPTDLYFPISPATHRRGPGQSPFLTPQHCADLLSERLQYGIAADCHGEEWWDREFPYVDCLIDVAAVETPLWLRSPAARLAVTVFQTADGTARIYRERFAGAFQIGIAADTTDEWWLAYDGSFREFRGALVEELRRRALPLDESSS